MNVGVNPLNVTGNLTVDGPVTGSAYITLDGTSAQTITSSVAGSVTNLNVANTTSIILTTPLVLAGNSTTFLGNGTFTGPGAVEFGNDTGNYITDYFVGTIPSAVFNLNGGYLNVYEPMNVGSLVVASPVSLSANQSFSFDPINVSGNVTLDGAIEQAGYNTYINLDGTTDQTVTSSVGSYLTNLNVANSTGHIVLATTLVLENGIFGGNLTGSGTFSGPGALQFGNEEDYNFSSYFSGYIPDAIVNVNPPEGNIGASSDFYLYQSLDVGSLVVDGVVQFYDQTFTGTLAVNVAGNLTLYGGVESGSSGLSINLVGTATQTITSATGGYVENLYADNGINVVLPTTLTLYNGTLTGDDTFSGTVQFGLGDGNGYSTDFSGSIDDVIVNLNSGVLSNNQTLFVNDTVTLLDSGTISGSPIMAGAAIYSGSFGSFRMPTTLTWTGADSLHSTDWSDPLNWSGDTTPQPGDTVIFNSTSAVDSVIDGSYAIGSLVENGYTGQISLGAQTLTVTNTFAIADAGSFDADTGTVLFAGSSANVSSAAPLFTVNVNLNASSGTLSLDAPLDVRNLIISDTVNLQDLSGNGSDPINVSGNLTLNGGVTGQINLVGTAQTITSSGAGFLTNLNVVGGDDVSLATTLILGNFGYLTGSGTFSGTGTVQFGYGNGEENYTAAYTSIIPNAILDLDGGTLVLDKPLTVGVLNLTSAVNLEDYTGNGTAPLDVTGNVTLDATVTGDGTIRLIGSSAQTVTSDMGGYLGNLDVANSSGSIVLPTTLVLLNGTLSGNGNLDGNVQIGIGTSSGGGGEDVRPDSSGGSQGGYSSSFTGTILDTALDLSGATLYLDRSLNVGGLNVASAVDLQDNSGNDTYTLNVSGNLILDESVTGTGFLDLVNTSTQTITTNVAGYVANLTVANTGDNVELASNLILQDILTGSGHFVNDGGTGTLQLGQGGYGNTFVTNFSGTIDNLVLYLNAYLDNYQILNVNHSPVQVGTNPVVSYPIDVAGQVAVTPTRPTADTTYGTTLIWTGADHANSTNWSDPGNWSIVSGTDTTPQPGDTVIFNSTSSVGSVINQAFDISSLLEDGYTGQISLGSQTLTITGNFSIADAASFNAGTGTVVFTGTDTGSDEVNSAASLANVVLNTNGATFLLDQPLNVQSLDSG